MTGTVGLCVVCIACSIAANDSEQRRVRNQRLRLKRLSRWNRTVGYSLRRAQPVVKGRVASALFLRGVQECRARNDRA